MFTRGAGWSLTRRLLGVMILALGAVGFGLGLVGTILVDRIVEQSFDKLIGASVQEIAGTVTLEDRGVSLDIPPSALGMLENEQGDSVFYSVRQGDRLLTGYGGLPTIDVQDVPPGERVFEDGVFMGQPVRMAAESRYLPRMPDPVVIQVAQTLNERQSLQKVMLGALYLLESTFVVIAALLIWVTLRWSLRPVHEIREELDSRPAAHADFAPLDLHDAPAELVGLVGGFNDLLSRLEGAVSRMRQFTADASHEMRTPLAVLKTHLAVLRDYIAPDSPSAHSLKDVRDAVRRLESLLTRLTTLAHAEEAGRGGIRRSAVDLRDVITNVVGDLVPLASERDINLSVDAAQRHAWVMAEPVIAAEILTNLLENAIRYNHPTGNVCISLRESADSITVSVEDDGPGIPSGELEHIFERFYRLPRDRSQPGSGLGLSIVRSLSEALEAEVSLEKATGGRGLKASVRFEAAA